MHDDRLSPDCVGLKKLKLGRFVQENGGGAGIKKWNDSRGNPRKVPAGVDGGSVRVKEEVATQGHKQWKSVHLKNTSSEFPSWLSG